MIITERVGLIFRMLRLQLPLQNPYQNQAYRINVFLLIKEHDLGFTIVLTLKHNNVYHIINYSCMYYLLLLFIHSIGAQLNKIYAYST